MKRSTYDSIYQNVPHKYVDELFSFRTSHPNHCLLIDDVEWSYILCGKGKETILILGGAMSTAETNRSLISSLEESYRVLAPAYPIYKSLRPFLDGLAKLLELENIQKVHVFGHSLGAGIAHAFIRRHPEKVDKLILSSFGLYSETSLQQARRLIRLFQLLPYWFVSGYYKRRMPKLMIGIDESEKLFMTAYMNDVLDLQLNKKMLMSQFRTMGDMYENSSTYRIYEPIENKNVLILQAKDDTGFNHSEQEALRRAYPEATVHIFEEGGHLTRTTHRAEYDSVLKSFL
jgi:pimeloyl-ACP methyl ester carboxylesterase